MSFRAVFLATWREIPDSSERQYLIENVLGHTTDNVADRMRAQGSFSFTLLFSYRGVSPPEPQTEDLFC